jgi:ATP-dependent RNA helicase DDX49/DBP8
MITSKRRALTTDDLLRRQEERLKRSPVAQRSENEDSSPGEDDDDFNLVSDDGEVGKDGGEWESEVEESADSETDNETPLLKIGRLDRFGESSSLLHSRVTVNPRLAHRRPLSPETGLSKHATFSSLGLSPLLLSALSKMAIHAPTEIQRACIPPLLAGFLHFTGILDHH